MQNNVYLWPDRLEFALQHTNAPSVALPFTSGEPVLPLETTSQKLQALDLISQHLKNLPQENLYAAIKHLETEMGVALSNALDVPDIYQPLTWEQCREMTASGLITLGGHTHHHLILGRCTEATMRDEITLNADLISENTGVRPTLFAYPNGKPEDYNATTRQMLVDHGYVGSVTTTHAFVRSESDPDAMALPRFGHSDSAAQLDFVTSGMSRFIRRNVVQRSRAALASF